MTDVVGYRKKRQTTMGRSYTNDFLVIIEPILMDSICDSNFLVINLYTSNKYLKLLNFQIKDITLFLH